MFYYQLSFSGRCNVFSLNGELAAGDDAQALLVAIEHLADQANIRVLFDMKQVTSIDSSGVGILLACKKAVEEIDGALAMSVQAESVIDRALHMMGVRELLNVFDDRSAATAYLRSCHVDQADLLNSVIQLIGKHTAPGNDSLLREIVRRNATHIDALAFLQQAGDEVSQLAGGNALLERNALNGLERLLGRLGEHYPRPAAPADRAALVILNDGSPTESLIVEAFLRQDGWSVCPVVESETKPAEIIAQAQDLDVGKVVICRGYSATQDAAETNAGPYRGLVEPPNVIVYAPTASPPVLEETIPRDGEDSEEALPPGVRLYCDLAELAADHRIE